MNEPDDDEHKWEVTVFCMLGCIAVVMVTWLVVIKVIAPQ